MAAHGLFPEKAQTKMPSVHGSSLRLGSFVFPLSLYISRALSLPLRIGQSHLFHLRLSSPSRLFSVSDRCCMRAVGRYWISNPPPTLFLLKLLSIFSCFFWKTERLWGRWRTVKLSSLFHSFIILFSGYRRLSFWLGELWKTLKVAESQNRWSFF